VPLPSSGKGVEGHGQYKSVVNETVRTIKYDQGLWCCITENLAAAGGELDKKTGKKRSKAPFVQFDLEGTGIREHIIVSTHPCDDSINWAQSEQQIS
jgi:hypothetical protein